MIGFLFGLICGLVLGGCLGVLTTALLVDSANRERMHRDHLVYLDDEWVEE